MNTDELAQKILNILSSRRFETWYGSGRFDAYVSGETNAPSEKEILEDIKKLLDIR